MKIAIDCRELGGQAGGFRTYLTGLLEGLATIDAENQYVLYAYPSANSGSTKLPTGSEVVAVQGGRLRSDWISLRRQIRADCPDVVHFPANYGVGGLTVPTVITLHDCISLKADSRCASAKSDLLRRYSALMTRMSVPKASVILTVSDYARGEIAKTLGCGDRVMVTYGADRPVTDDETPADEPSNERTEPYILALASVDPRKNTKLVIEAFAKTALANRSCRLVIVASHSAAARMVRDQAAELQVLPLVDVLTDVDDPSLRRLYARSTAFVFPSLEEGFGLPPLEAMACRAVVLSSDRTSMPEVLGDAALYFDPTDADDLARKMDMVTGNAAIREQLIAAGRERVARFSWEETARRTLEAYGLAALCGHPQPTR